jgi:hypothetical protein
MKSILSAAFVALLFIGCSQSGQWLPSYTDPDFQNVAFRSIAVFSDTSDLDWRKSFERGVTEAMRDEEASCTEGSMLMPPTRAYTAEQVRDVLRGRGIDAWLTIHADRWETYDEIIPEVRKTVKEKEPIVEKVRVRQNGKWVVKDSVTGSREIATTKTDPARTVRHTRVQFHAALIDVLSGRTAWIGDDWAVIDGRYMNDLCEHIAKQLLKDGIVRKKGK